MVGRECEHYARDGHVMWGTLSAAVRSTWGHVSVAPFRGQSCEPYDPLKVLRVMVRAAGIAPTPMVIATVMYVACTRVRCRGVA